MDLGFLPESMRYFAVSGRASLIGPKGNSNAPLGIAGGGIATVSELNDGRREQGDMGGDPLAFRRRVGCLSLLAEQVGPEPYS